MIGMLIILLPIFIFGIVGYSFNRRICNLRSQRQNCMNKLLELNSSLQIYQSEIKLLRKEIESLRRKYE
jgi:hypothetical protein